MSYLKLCQVQSEVDNTLIYLEDCNGSVVVNHPQYPLTIVCEVIDWVSQAEFNKRGAIENRYSEEVTISEYQPSIRQYVYEALVTKYPALVQ